MGLNVIILAAGQGTRMKSSLPKVLHHLAGKPLLSHVIDVAQQLSHEQLHIVYGHGGEQVVRQLDQPFITWVEQAEQNGTGHAVQLALQDIDDSEDVLVLYGDVPLINPLTLEGLLDITKQLGVLTAILDNPTGYGRILRDENGRLTGIVEQRDATQDQLSIDEINTGIMVGKAGLLKKLLSRVDNANDQGELYLTDVVALAHRQGIEIDSIKASSEVEISGINDRIQLAVMERAKQEMIAKELMAQGVTVHDPSRLDVRGELICGRDVIIDINCVIEGRVEIRDGVRIGPNVCLKDCVIGESTTIKANSVIEGAITGENVIVGPFARLRPGTELANDVHVGNFVEIKNSRVSEQAKINHLSYVGDSDVGARVNVGAGTITCNYDGANKHRTVIEDDAFIGSGTELVAPIRIGKGATIGAGSTLTRDAPENELTIERGQQKSVSGWKRPTKKPTEKS